MHAEVLKFCRAELLEDNYFHAVLEATKSVADRLRGLSGLSEDGSELADQARCPAPRGIHGWRSVPAATSRNEVNKRGSPGWSKACSAPFGILLRMRRGYRGP